MAEGYIFGAQVAGFAETIVADEPFQSFGIYGCGRAGFFLTAIDHSNRFPLLRYVEPYC